MGKIVKVIEKIDREICEVDFIHSAELEFSDISSELDREYCFPNGSRLLIDKPLFLNVSKSGGHRIFTADEWCYYVQPKEGWWVRWMVGDIEGKDIHFVK